ncbi:hypothetical protein IFM47457_07310 [Aspergillus lentulus]|nr:hypothetical protein IFM47457_07310 [Aspergillus lentulus]
MNSSANPEAGIQIMAAQFLQGNERGGLIQNKTTCRVILAQRSLLNSPILRHLIQVAPRVNPSDSNVGFGEVNMNQQRSNSLLGLISCQIPRRDGSNKDQQRTERSDQRPKGMVAAVIGCASRTCSELRLTDCFPAQREDSGQTDALPRGRCLSQGLYAQQARYNLNGESRIL